MTPLSPAISIFSYRACGYSKWGILQAEVLIETLATLQIPEASMTGSGAGSPSGLPCHGENAKGGTNAALVGGDPLKDMESAKTIANFWPYATTAFDYIRRAMPWRQPRTLTNDEVYALTPYILSLNKLIGDNNEVNAKTLPKVKDAEPRRIHHPLPGHVEGVLILRPVGKTWDY